MFNSGYCSDGSQSINSLAAKREDTLPISLVDMETKNRYGFKGSLKLFKKVVQEFGDTGEWHHTGTYFNETSFYDVPTAVETWDKMEENKRIKFVEDMKAEEQREKEKADEKIRVQGEYIEWGGSRNYPTRKLVKFEGYYKNGWIFTDSGNRKKSNGNYIEYEFVK